MIEQYSKNITDVIYVVDSTDIHNITYANFVMRQFLAKYVNPNANLLVLANKQDETNIFSLSEIEEEFELRHY